MRAARPRAGEPPSPSRPCRTSSPPNPSVPPPASGRPHAQTLFAALVRRAAPPGLHRERLVLPDGDFLDVDHLRATGGRTAPVPAARTGGEQPLGLHHRAARRRPRPRLRGLGAQLPLLLRRGQQARALLPLGRDRRRPRGPPRAARRVHGTAGGRGLQPRRQRAAQAAGRGRRRQSPLRGRGGQHAVRSAGLCQRAGPGAAAWAPSIAGPSSSSLKRKALAKARRHPGPSTWPGCAPRGACRTSTRRSPRRCTASPPRPRTTARAPAVHGSRRSAGPPCCSPRPTIPWCPQAFPRTPRDSPWLHVLQVPRGGHVGFVAGRSAPPVVGRPHDPRLPGGRHRTAQRPPTGAPEIRRPAPPASSQRGSGVEKQAGDRLQWTRLVSPGCDYRIPTRREATTPRRLDSGMAPPPFVCEEECVPRLEPAPPHAHGRLAHVRVPPDGADSSNWYSVTGPRLAPVYPQRGGGVAPTLLYRPPSRVPRGGMVGESWGHATPRSGGEEPEESTGRVARGREFGPRPH